ncbi:beta-propeller domain-containing protein [Gimesia algae]|nr:hypothetical protein [Gimesia algae]
MLQFTVRGEAQDQQPGEPLKDVKLELVYQSRQNEKKQITLGTVITDEHGLAKLQIKLPPDTAVGSLLAKLSRDRQNWERELHGFPQTLTHSLMIPVSEEPDYLNPDWIEKRLAQVGIDVLLEEYETEKDPLIQTVQGTLELSQHVLRKNPEALREQLQARLIGRPEPELAVFQQLPKDRVQFRSEWPTFDEYNKRSRFKRKTMTNCIAIASDGKFAITANDSTLILRDLNTKKILQLVTGHTDRVTCITITRDSNYVVSGDVDKTIRIWKYDNGKLQLVNILRGHIGPIRNIAISEDGKQIISYSFDRTMRSDRTMKVWDFTSGKVISTYDRSYSTCIALNQKYLISSSILGLKVWDITNGLSKGTLIRNLAKHTGDAGVSERINYVAFSPSGDKLMTGSDGNTLSLWELPSLQVVQTLKGHSDHITSAAMTSNGKQVISSSKDNTLRLWSLQDGELIKTYELADTAQVIKISSDEKSVIVGCSSGRFHKLTIQIPKAETMLD